MIYVQHEENRDRDIYTDALVLHLLHIKHVGIET